MSELTPDEEKILKEFAQNLLATNRIGRVIKSGLVWLASAIGAGYIVVEFFIKQRGG